MTRGVLIGVCGLVLALGACGDSSKGGQPQETPDGGAAPMFVCARPLDTATTTLFYDAARCLFEGPEAPQQGVAPGTIEPERVAIVRGRAVDTAGMPLPGARVSIPQHVEYGTTTTRSDGGFEMAVNGGGVITLRYEKDGYLVAQRHLTTEWRMFAVFPDVALLPQTAEVATVELGNAAVVVRGPRTTDPSGARQPWAIFAPNTTVNMVLPDGSKQPLASLHLRMTEYTVGERGPAAMPGDLPASSAYTYATEFGVDEATAAGATRVELDPPLVTYVDNFLRFPAGTVVPIGAYDRDRDVWEGAESGQVVQVMAIDNGVAQLDTDGDGAADEDAVLSRQGITTEERQALAQQYSAGESAWRVKLAHFSAWDINWPFGPPADAVAPSGGAVGSASQEDCQTTAGGSIIGCESQTLGEDIALKGTPHALHYQSERMPGRLDVNQLDIRLSDATVPPSLKRIELEVETLGQVTKKTFPPSPNLHDAYTWDGKDAWGRSWQGGQTATVRIGYVYDGSYQRTERFGYSGNGVPITGDKARQELTLWSTRRATLGTLRSDLVALGGWSLSAQHAFDPRGGVLYFGDGQRRSAARIGNIITTVAGTGETGYSGDDGPAIAAKIGNPHGLLVGPDGSVYYAGDSEHRVRKIAPNGIITTYAGTGEAGFSGDGGPATAAQLSKPMGLAMGKDGTLYIADSGNQRVRAVSPAGVITTVAGGGDVQALTAGDAGPATKAILGSAHALALGPDGVLYVCDPDSELIRAIGVDGIIHTYAGGGRLFGDDADGHPALEAALGDPLGMVVSPTNDLYVTEWAIGRVRKIDANGIMTTVVGGGTGTTDGILAKDSAISSPHTVDLASDGTLYITEEGTRRVRRIRPDGVIDTVAGGGMPVDGQGDNGDPLSAAFGLPRVVYVHKDRSIWVADYGSDRVRRIQSSMPGFTTGEIAIASQDGSTVFAFDDHGRHLRTVDALTKVVLDQFTYDAAGRLATVQDQHGNTTTVDRDAVGRPISITGPYGQKTQLAIGSDGYLARATDANGAATELTYGNGGLLATMSDPRAATELHRFTYDAFGRLLEDADPSGYAQTLARSETPTGYAVALHSKLGRTRTHDVQITTDGSTQIAVTDPDGTVTTTVRSASALTRTTPTSTSKSTFVGDPRFRMQSPLVASIELQQLEGGPKTTIAHKRNVTSTDANDPLSVTKLVDGWTVNGRSSTLTWDAATSTWTALSAAGRTTSWKLDSLGHVVSSQQGALLPVTFTYDERGRLTQTSRGDRTFQSTFDAAGRVAAVLDPLLQKTSFAYDAGGRATAVTLADGSTMAFAYDGNDHVVGITPPGAMSHAFTYAPGDLLSAYTAPAANDSGSNKSQYTYNEDKQLSSVIDPGGRAATSTFDAQSGRLTAMTLPEAALALTYDAAGRPSSATRAEEALTFGYQGDLLARLSWTGPVHGEVSRTYDANLWMSAESVNGSTIPYTYDADGRLTRAADEVLSYDRSGLLVGVNVGRVTELWTVNEHGEVLGTTATAAGLVAFETTSVRDKLGRVATRTEGVQGESHKLDYRYDVRGRLTEVMRDGVSVATYGYDKNGNRTSAAGVIATYDAQDRLLTSGNASYAYTPSGHLARRTRDGATTSFSYDVAGNLLGVTLPDGTVIDYVIDGGGRRVGKKVNGALVQGWLYRSGLQPIAELDSAGAVTSRFVYGSRGNVPDLVVKGGVTYRIVSDQLGSPRLVVNTASGQIAQRIDYDSWGNVLSDSAPGFQPFGFAGGLYDRDTKLVRFGARDYDAEVGRWTGKDPIFFGSGQANVYAYIGNDPINGIDQNGLWGVTDAIGIAWGAWGWVNGGDAPTVRLDPDAGAVFTVEFQNHPGQRRAGYSTTFGNVICYGGSPSLDTVQHELAHTRQYRVLGDVYLPAHLVSQGVSLILTGNYSDANVLEMGPYSKQHPAWPWGNFP